MISAKQSGLVYSGERKVPVEILELGATPPLRDGLTAWCGRASGPSDFRPISGETYALVTGDGQAIEIRVHGARATDFSFVGTTR